MLPATAKHHTSTRPPHLRPCPGGKPPNARGPRATPTAPGLLATTPETLLTSRLASGAAYR
eukprot:13831749-Alexandrium_andersonii.AAC.1